ncbi:MAG: hypothetical protein COB67_05020 [SAR324 cluster bacterium]|uniref:tRNA1(Val) (adenine(37)-N6)-methyltransferase n=1 Tax=SAR324 cluster bacterium TaxID=2024889 RepID=A0A2A4T5X9_9DELT|nr:MAG: hypothetical protein COB67_05020 [SAR324 cluster bacterium]
MAGRGYFQFKQFQVNQEHCAMKITTDSCLLGAYVPVGQASTILDIGAGTGVLALMLAQRSTCWVDAVEIDRDTVCQAEANMLQSPWRGRLQIYEASVQNFMGGRVEQYDCIVSNPPYYSQSQLSVQRKKKIAWHDVTLNFYDLVHAAKRLLSNEGTFHLILPFLETQRFIDIAVEQGLFPVERLNIAPQADRPVNRVILSLSHHTKTLIEKDFVLYQDHQVYTHQARTLFSPYYLAL